MSRCAQRTTFPRTGVKQLPHAQKEKGPAGADPFPWCGEGCYGNLGNRCNLGLPTRFCARLRLRRAVGVRAAQCADELAGLVLECRETGCYQLAELVSALAEFHAELGLPGLYRLDGLLAACLELVGLLAQLRLEFARLVEHRKLLQP